MGLVVDGSMDLGTDIGESLVDFFAGADDITKREREPEIEIGLVTSLALSYLRLLLV